MVKYQPHLLVGCGNCARMAVRATEREPPGFGTGALPIQPTSSNRQTDALEMEECRQMGFCLSFRPF